MIDSRAIPLKLLFDQNLPRLLEDLFPESLHVLDAALDAVEDGTIWEYAKAHDFTIATKDSDFRALSEALGHPPKVMRIRLGNGPTAEVEALLRERYQDLLSFQHDAGRGFLALL